jgi:hypothetical protein
MKRARLGALVIPLLVAGLLAVALVRPAGGVPARPAATSSSIQLAADVAARLTHGPPPTGASA